MTWLLSPVIEELPFLLYLGDIVPYLFLELLLAVPF